MSLISVFITVKSQAEHSWIIRSSRFHSFGSKRTPITFLQMYYLDFTGQHKDIKKETKTIGSTKEIKIAMTLHHHPHSSLQKNL
jgi:hypothetical protein